MLSKKRKRSHQAAPTMEITGEIQEAYKPILTPTSKLISPPTTPRIQIAIGSVVRRYSSSANAPTSSPVNPSSTNPGSSNIVAPASALD